MHPSSPAHETATAGPRDTLVVTGTGRATGRPDALVLDLQLEGHGPSVPEALAALTRATEDCRAALPEHDVRTHGLGVHPRHDHQGRPVGHTAYQSLRTRTTDPASAGDLVQRLGEAVGSALGLTGLRPELTETADLERQARERAVAAARVKAQDYARLVGRELGAVLWLREVCGLPSPGLPESARFAMDASGGPAVDPGDEEVLVVVELAFGLGTVR